VILSARYVRYTFVKKQTLGKFCITMIGRADNEESKSDVATNAQPPQASYPCGNFSVTSKFDFRKYETERTLFMLLKDH